MYKRHINKPTWKLFDNHDFGSIMDMYGSVGPQCFSFAVCNCKRNNSMQCSDSYQFFQVSDLFKKNHAQTTSIWPDIFSNLHMKICNILRWNAKNAHNKRPWYSKDLHV